MNRQRLKAGWDYLQSLLDIDGDVWMGLFTGAVILRLLLVLRGYAPLTTAEAAAYGSAIGSFAWSNRGPK